MPSRPCTPALALLSSLVSAIDTTKKYTKLPVTITVLVNTVTEATISFLPYSMNNQETDLFSLPWSVFLMFATSISPHPAVSYFYCIFDRQFLAAHLSPSFPTRFFPFNSPSASSTFSPLLFALFLHFL